MSNLTGKIKSVKNFRETGKTVLLRTDYNMSLTPVNGFIDDTRLQSSLPTIEYLLSLHSKIIILAHKGRPKGKKSTEESMHDIAQYLAQKLHKKFVEVEDETKSFPNYPVPHVIFYRGDVRRLTREKIDSELQPGNILFLENIRFYPEEESDISGFSKKLAALADVFVNEGFSVAHHASASTVGLTEYLPKYAGLQLIKEVETLEHIQKNASKPFVIVAGGAKISEKVKMLETLLPQADYLLVGGAMANLFFKVKDFNIGDSLYEQEGVLAASNLLRNFKEKIVLPVDVVIGRREGVSAEVKAASSVRPGEKILDIGPQSILKYADIIKTAQTIVWNGPMGLFEEKNFSHGTTSLARLIASRGMGEAFVVVGGGETLEAVHQVKMKESIDFVSTGGGAMLSFLGGEELPGLTSLV